MERNVAPLSGNVCRCADRSGDVRSVAQSTPVANAALRIFQNALVAFPAFKHHREALANPTITTKRAKAVVMAMAIIVWSKRSLSSQPALKLVKVFSVATVADVAAVKIV